MARLSSLLISGLVQAFLINGIPGTQLHGNDQNNLRTEAKTITFQQELMQSLMICNAYATDKALDIYELGSQRKLTAARPLAYKQCADEKLMLREGSQFEFRSGNLSVGVFRATGVPRAPAALLLIVHRRSPRALTAAFQSHAFTDLGSSQLVVIDVYRGNETGKVKIMDIPKLTQGDSGKEKAAPQRSEDLKFNSVVQVNPGDYEIMLQDGGEKNLASVPLHVSDREQAKFVVMRTGNSIGAEKVDSSLAFPQELVVHQQGRSGAKATAHLQLMLAVAVALLSALVAAL